jgi:hypothetical protein
MGSIQQPTEDQVQVCRYQKKLDLLVEDLNILFKKVDYPKVFGESESVIGLKPLKEDMDSKIAPYDHLLLSCTNDDIRKCFIDFEMQLMRFVSRLVTSITYNKYLTGFNNEIFWHYLPKIERVSLFDMEKIEFKIICRLSISVDCSEELCL